MKKFVFFFIIICSGVCVAAACSRSDETPTVAAKIFFADAELNRLLPYEEELPDVDKEHMAQAAIETLKAGKPDNEKIRQLLPSGRGDVTVTVRDSTAYVDLDRRIAEQLPDSRDIERLIVYQIVDTLTSIKGIRYVRFTVDGSIRKDFMGYYDMRETYKYTYPE